MVEHSKKRAKLDKKYQLVLLVLLFLIPPAAAFILFYADFRPSSGSNYGQLISPAKPITDVILTTPDGREFKLSNLRRKWVLLYLGGHKCNEACSDNLYKIHQVRLTQGKNIERVTSVYIAPEGVLQSEVDDISGKYPGVLLLLAHPDTYADLVNQFGNEVEVPLQGPERVYIVDPLGNLVMRYETEADPSGMKKDLKRLLKLSQIG